MKHLRPQYHRLDPGWDKEPKTDPREEGDNIAIKRDEYQDEKPLRPKLAKPNLHHDPKATVTVSEPKSGVLISKVLPKDTKRGTHTG